jgi:hypothetical protein
VRSFRIDLTGHWPRKRPRNIGAAVVRALESPSDPRQLWHRARGWGWGWGDPSLLVLEVAHRTHCLLELGPADRVGVVDGL